MDGTAGFFERPTCKVYVPRTAGVLNDAHDILLAGPCNACQKAEAHPACRSVRQEGVLAACLVARMRSLQRLPRHQASSCLPCLLKGGGRLGCLPASSIPCHSC